MLRTTASASAASLPGSNLLVTRVAQPNQRVLFYKAGTVRTVWLRPATVPLATLLASTDLRSS